MSASSSQWGSSHADDFEINSSYATLSGLKAEEENIVDFSRSFPARRIPTVGETLQARLREASLERMSEASNDANPVYRPSLTPVNATPLPSAHHLGYYPTVHSTQCSTLVDQRKRKRGDEADCTSDVSELRMPKQRKVQCHVDPPQYIPHGVLYMPTSEFYKQNWQVYPRRRF